MHKNSTEAGTKLKELTAKINAKHEQCQAEPAQALLYGCTIGNLLLLVKSMLPGAEWQRWLTECCSFSLATAQTYIAIAGADFLSPFPQKISQSVLEKQEENSHQLEGLSSIPRNPVSDGENADISLINSQKQGLSIGSLGAEDEVVIATASVVEETKKKQEANASYSAVEKTSDRSSNSTDMVIVIEPKEGNLYSEIKKEENSDRSNISTAKAKETSSQYLLEKPENNSQKSVYQKNQKTTKKIVNPNSNNLVFYIPGKVVPKARPRVTSKGTYLPPRYRKWRNMAEVEICRQVLDMNIKEKLPIKKAAISLSFCGKHRTNSDLDNMAGACLDALTLNGAGVLKDDRLSCIPQLNVEYIADRQETGVWITITILNRSCQ